MPFGLIFGALAFTLLGVWIAGSFLIRDSLLAQATGALYMVLGFSLALGLLLRQRWARWSVLDEL